MNVTSRVREPAMTVMIRKISLALLTDMRYVKEVFVFYDDTIMCYPCALVQQLIHDIVLILRKSKVFFNKHKNAEYICLRIVYGDSVAKLLLKPLGDRVIGFLVGGEESCRTIHSEIDSMIMKLRSLDANKLSRKRRTSRSPRRECRTVVNDSKMKCLDIEASIDGIVYSVDAQRFLGDEV